MEYTLTSKGADLLTKLTTNSNSLHLSKAKAGSGYSANPEYLTDVIDEKRTAQIADASFANGKATITIIVNNTNQAEEYKLRNVGLFAIDDETSEEILFVVGQDSTGDKMPAVINGSVEYKYIINITIANSASVVIDVQDNDYVLKKVFNETVLEIKNDMSDHIKDKENPHGVTKNQVELGNVPNVTTNDQTPTYNLSSELSKLTSGEKLAVAFGKISRAINSLIDHIANKENPHGVTKTQVSLGNVPNVATNDQTPSYAEAATLSALSSGEKLSVAFGKIKKAISSLISHMADKTIHYTTANNLTTTEEGLALDARQGKAINDSLKKENIYSGAILSANNTVSIPKMTSYDYLNIEFSVSNVIVDSKKASKQGITGASMRFTYCIGGDYYVDITVIDSTHISINASSNVVSVGGFAIHIAGTNTL